MSSRGVQKTPRLLNYLISIIIIYGVILLFSITKDVKDILIKKKDASESESL